MSDEAAGEPVEEPPPPFPPPAGTESAGRLPGPPPATPVIPSPRPGETVVVEPTGDPRVDEVLARLGELNTAPVAEHVAVFEEIHQRLQELLASADQQEEPRPPVPRPAGAWRTAMAGQGAPPEGHGRRP